MSTMPTGNDASEPGEDRAAFMQRVRASLGNTRTDAPDEPAPAIDQALVRLAGVDDDLLAMFRERAIGTGMHVHRVDQPEATAKVCEVIRDARAHRIGVAAGIIGQQLGLEAALRNAGLEVAEWRSAPGMDGQYDLDAGITDVHAALAETGTIVLCSGARHSRGLSLAPHTHLALVRSSDVIPDMIDYWQRLKGIPNTELPSSQVFVTGPSKTADIEGELITGVHGPGNVHIVLIEDM